MRDTAPRSSFAVARPASLGYRLRRTRGVSRDPGTAARTPEFVSFATDGFSSVLAVYPQELVAADRHASAAYGYAAWARRSAMDAGRDAAAAAQAETDAWRAAAELERQELEEWRKASGIPDKKPGETLTPEEQKKLVGAWIGKLCGSIEGKLACAAGKAGTGTDSMALQIVKACQNNPRCATIEQLDWLLEETFNRYLTGVTDGFNKAFDWGEVIGQIATGGRLVFPDYRVGINGEPTLDPPSPSGPSKMDDWIKQRLQAGVQFNKDNWSRYPINELYVGTQFPYKRLDSYVPNQEIVSRKFTQLAKVADQTGVGYVGEMRTKYGPGVLIPDTPYNRQYLDKYNLRDKGLQGKLILEIPVQEGAVPQAVLDAAAKGRPPVTIRDTNNKIYN
ncbi:hypothetical protein [Amycolatopsis silviterrae]|uniref:Uncharacterized protein n=1 Tax=Amycolatopsis silviterrae TaxID=1656914 RepID=A0ABW5HL48_9PSEU